MPRSSIAGFRFRPDVIVVAVRLRYGQSYRDVEELLAERGIAVDHVSAYRWVQRFTPLPQRDQEVGEVVGQATVRVTGRFSSRTT